MHTLNGCFFNVLFKIYGICEHCVSLIRIYVSVDVLFKLDLLSYTIRFSDEMELRHAFNVTGCGRTLPEDEVHGFGTAVDELTRDFKQLATMLLTVIISDLFNNCISFMDLIPGSLLIILSLCAISALSLSFYLFFHGWSFHEEPRRVCLIFE